MFSRTILTLFCEILYSVEECPEVSYVRNANLEIPNSKGENRSFASRALI